jgi:hypothetical protein
MRPSVEELVEIYRIPPHGEYTIWPGPESMDEVLALLHGVTGLSGHWALQIHDGGRGPRVYVAYLGDE